MKKKGYGDRKDREDRHVIRRNKGGLVVIHPFCIFYGCLIFCIFYFALLLPL